MFAVSVLPAAVFFVPALMTEMLGLCMLLRFLSAGEQLHTADALIEAVCVLLGADVLARALWALDVRRENKCSIHFPLANKKGKNVNAAVSHFPMSPPRALSLKMLAARAWSFSMHRGHGSVCLILINVLVAAGTTV